MIGAIIDFNVPYPSFTPTLIVPINSVINNYKTGDIIDALTPLFKESHEYRVCP